METKQEYFLEILPNDCIQVLIQTVYYKPGGSELTRENWRTYLSPDDVDYAREILDDRSFSIATTVWNLV